LDEVGEVPLEQQSKLLRALQEKEYERVGDDRTRHADVRIVAATNRDLQALVAAGRFRPDLYYRLNIFPIEIAPLRERSEDITLLAEYFVEVVSREMKCRRPRLTAAGLTSLQAYHWPGNIRELRNVIERAVIMARGGALRFRSTGYGCHPRNRSIEVARKQLATPNRVRVVAAKSRKLAECAGADRLED
jgi:transcriptional regulator with GAF, ATPase, and Fis domain